MHSYTRRASSRGRQHTYLGRADNAPSYHLCKRKRQRERGLARHIGAHIPGKPNVIVQNLPGAGGRRLANAFQLTGPRDGTAIGITTPGIVTD